MTGFLNDSLVHQINIQSEDLARQMIEYQHKIDSRITEIQRAALEMIKLSKDQLGISKDDSKIPSSNNLVSKDEGLGALLESLLQTSSSLIHSIQESSMDEMSVNRLKLQVSIINKLLNSLGI